MDIFIDIALSIDRTIYTAIPKVYDLIIRLAGYEVFKSDTINGLSRRIYALLGIFMLFKLSFSMISYIVNPDDFSDKSKGFGGLIKNVIISMVLIVAVPYIFAEAFYVQKTILEDGTIVKLIFAQGGSGDESNTDNSSVTYKGDEGEELSFILFTQFVKPNEAIPSIKDDCRRIYKIGDDGKRVSLVDDSGEVIIGAYEIDSKCNEALEAAFTDENNYQHYIDGIQYQNYEILVNNPDIFKDEAEPALVLNQKSGTTSSKKSKVKVISYNWFLCFIFGIVTLLFLVTLCIDVATRTIKLAFYQIIAPVPIISNCDPKAKKDGMFNKWVKACISTYLDLFIRLAMFYLAIFIIKSFTDKFFVSRTSGYVTLFIVLGALVFAKQAPKIVEDLTGLKMENFTLNPFKKISNEALGGKAMLGAAGGAIAGAVGGGGHGIKGLAGRGLSVFTGAARGGINNKGFMAGMSTQADVNRKMRDARIAGAGFFGSRLAGVASTFGLDDATLEREGTALRVGEDIIAKTRRDIDSKNKGVDSQKNSLERRILPKKNLVSKQTQAISDLKKRQENATNLIKGDKAGEYFKLMHHRYQTQDAYVKSLSELKDFTGVTLRQDIQSADGKHIFTKEGKHLIKSGNSYYEDSTFDGKLSKDILDLVGVDNTGYYENKIGRDDLLNHLDSGDADKNRDYVDENRNRISAGGVGQDKIDSDKELKDNIDLSVKNYNDYLEEFKNGTYGELDQETNDAIAAGETYLKIDLDALKTSKGSYSEALATQISDSENRNSQMNRSMSKINIEIEELDRQKKANITDATVVIDGVEYTLEDAERIYGDRRKEYDLKVKEHKLYRDRAKDERIFKQ